ncbi:MAG: hypothetical protein IGR80_14025 [Synechococcales cyanobacterium K44_A2020_017]|nr:hypothetical protein [Synechococcales cyanobacterium K32_A2020_035]MBF2095862.1 hypothetical protein [Synechococcales cyanobacterium K44_A2020_017]
MPASHSLPPILLSTFRYRPAAQMIQDFSTHVLKAIATAYGCNKLALFATEDILMD